MQMLLDHSTPKLENERKTCFLECNPLYGTFGKMDSSLET